MRCQVRTSLDTRTPAGKWGIGQGARVLHGVDRCGWVIRSKFRHNGLCDAVGIGAELGNVQSTHVCGSLGVPAGLAAAAALQRKLPWRLKHHPWRDYRVGTVGRPPTADSRPLTTHQFLQTDQSVGSPQMDCRQVWMRRRPRVKKDIRPRATFLGRDAGSFFRRGVQCSPPPTCPSRQPSRVRAP